jgi:hypothetical protein
VAFCLVCNQELMSLGISPRLVTGPACPMPVRPSYFRCASMLIVLYCVVAARVVFLLALRFVGEALCLACADSAVLVMCLDLLPSSTMSCVWSRALSCCCSCCLRCVVLQKRMDKDGEPKDDE